MHTKRLIVAGTVIVNGQVQLKASTRLIAGDCIEWETLHDEKQDNHSRLTGWDLEMLYEDSAILVLNKPPGLVVHEGDVAGEETVVSLLQAQGVSLYPQEGKRPGVVHRLDRYTEGVMVFAKTEEAYTGLCAQFKNRQVYKRYVAMVVGNVKNDQMTIRQPIARQRRSRNKYTVNPAGKEAHTDVTVLRRYNSKTLCKVRLHTGRTHQIRVHLHFIGHPVLGDPLYGKTTRQPHTEQLLQATCLGFTHPTTQQYWYFHVPFSKRLWR